MKHWQNKEHYLVRDFDDHWWLWCLQRVQVSAQCDNPMVRVVFLVSWSLEVGNDVDNLLEARELVDDDLETLALVLAIAVVRIHLALRPMCGALTATKCLEDF